jgi:hypothetical protein
VQIGADLRLADRDPGLAVSMLPVSWDQPHPGPPIDLVA